MQTRAPCTAAGQSARAPRMLGAAPVRPTTAHARRRGAPQQQDRRAAATLPHHRRPARRAPAAAASASAADANASAGRPPSPLASLQQAVPVDRLRYQALLVFNHFDADGDGALSPAEYAAYSAYAAGKAPWAPAVGAALAAAAAPFVGPAQPVSREAFVSLVRAQTAALAAPAASGGALDAPGAAGIVPQEVARLEAMNGLRRTELLAARWAFLMMDLDGDNKVALADVERAGGVEAGIAEARGLEDSDADDDGLVTFEEYLSATYSKPKEPFKAAAVLIANTLLVWLVFQAPVDLFIKGAAVVALLLKPQLVARPVIWLHDAIFGLINGARARAELSRRGGAAAA